MKIHPYFAHGRHKTRFGWKVHRDWTYHRDWAYHFIEIGWYL